MGTLQGEAPSFQENTHPDSDKTEPDISAGGVLELDTYFTPESTDALEEIADQTESIFSEEAENKLKKLKKDLKKLTDRVETLEEDAETSMLPESDDPVGALLARLAMKDRKRTFKIVYGIVKEYAGSNNADPARIPLLFRELFELCVTGNLK